jgi:hypothetical protein
MIYNYALSIGTHDQKEVKILIYHNPHEYDKDIKTKY